MSFRQRTSSRVMVVTTVLTFFILGGFRGEGIAITAEGPLQVEGDRLTGHLSQVTLGAILKQLQKQLGITYEAPVGELDKVISVDLQQVPVIPALATILAPWDYAFTANSKGQLKFLYITPKAPAAETTPEINEPSEGYSSEADMETQPVYPDDSGQETGDVDLALPQEQEQEASASAPSASTFDSPPEEMQGFNSPSAGDPMAIQPVPEGTAMPLMPPSGGSGMNVTPAANPPDMPIIPGTAYPPMDIQPVPDYLQEEMLRNLQP